MDFVHKAYEPGETIAAIATPPGEGGIAVIRITGENALAIAQKVFTGNVFAYTSHTAHYGRIINDEKEIVDDVLLLVMLGRRSYCGEDTVEIHCHGGSIITRKVLETILKAGARPALPGEFTYKAFMNGKLDLAQAEAVQQLIGAKNELALKAAENHLQGALSRTIQSFQFSLVDIASILEAWVDFPEEGLEFASLEEVLESLRSTLSKMHKLLHTFHEGKIIREGLSLCLAGSPNVGKSSLMNALLGKERAIVTDIPGTTRDVIEEDLKLGQLHFRLIDTAGIRETEEIVEKEGIRRTKRAMEEADIVLYVIDSQRPLSPEEQGMIHLLPPTKTIIACNKLDLPSKTLLEFPFKTVKVSAKTGLGLETLKDAISERIWTHGAPSKDEVMITSYRHHTALTEASEALSRVIAGLETGISPEFLSFEMRRALNELGTIIGTNVTEDILNSIFSKFCVGK